MAVRACYSWQKGRKYCCSCCGGCGGPCFDSNRSIHAIRANWAETAKRRAMRNRPQRNTIWDQQLTNLPIIVAVGDCAHATIPVIANVTDVIQSILGDVIAVVGAVIDFDAQFITTVAIIILVNVGVKDELDCGRHGISTECVVWLECDV